MGLKRILLAAGLSLVMTLIPMTALADSDDPWEFEGGGWGHGVGLSQFGALGQAETGLSAAEILQFYYTGTEVKSGPDHWTNDDDGLWVGLVRNSTTSSVSLSAVNGPITVCLSDSGCDKSQILEKGQAWEYEVNEDNSNECRLHNEKDDIDSGWSDCSATISDHSPSDRVKVNGTEYARGTIRFDTASKGFHAVVTLDMETYLYGLAEVPSGWHMEALKAQATIGRSFALATAAERGGEDGSKKSSTCGCHIRNTTSDQVYVGWSKEDPAKSGERWKDAVDHTAGQILVHDQSDYFAKVAKAFYSSSNGGWSENNEDVWPGSPLPWLRSVEDKWSSDPDINPLARWTVEVSDTDLVSHFGWDRVLNAVVLQGPPDVLVQFTGRKDGSSVEKTLNGTEIASLLRNIGSDYKALGSSSTQVRVSPYILAVDGPGGFEDTVGHTFEVAIDWMLAENITVGCNPPDNTEYCPDDSVTRGQMAVFISRVLGLESTDGDHFDDDDGKFYESAANRLFEAGITVGCDDGRFCGDQTMTREQMAAFMIRALDDPPAASKDYFKDDDGSQFEKAINQMAEAKVTLGCNPPANDRYCPGDDVTRGQMAAFFRRAWGP